MIFLPAGIRRLASRPMTGAGRQTKTARPARLLKGLGNAKRNEASPTLSTSSIGFMGMPEERESHVQHESPIRIIVEAIPITFSGVSVVWNWNIPR